jgi:hypothetical protein
MYSEDAAATRRIRHLAGTSRKTRAFREQHEGILAIRKSVWQSRNGAMLGRYEVQLMMAMQRCGDEAIRNSPCVSAKLHAALLRYASGAYFGQEVVRAAGGNQHSNLTTWVVICVFLTNYHGQKKTLLDCLEELST